MVDKVLDQETAAAFAAAAPVVNKFYLHQTPFWVRLTFSEEAAAQQPNIRAAVAMAPGDAHALADLIKALVPPPTPEQIAAAQKTEQTNG